jgi:5'-AMP-activated protein kinase regulatory beta subunit
MAVPVCTAALQYKFIVDGDWKHDPNQRAMRDENGNVNNVIEVQEYVPENLENISGFDPPPSPAARYASSICSSRP